MNNSAYGLVHDYYPREKMISIKWDSKISYFYFPKTLFKDFEKAMKYRSVYVFFDYSLDKPKVLKNIDAYPITELHRITVETSRGPENIYTIGSKKENLIKQIESYEYKMFVDFEFTMPAYGDKSPFKPEILQIGSVVSDKNDIIVNEYSTYIKTNNKVTDRAMRFLKIYPEDLEDSVEPITFYNELKSYINIYKPVIFVWGGNDIQTLESFYELHGYEKLDIKVVDLLKVIRQYYNLNTDIGLFRALRYFKGIQASQAHHALTDASATKEVFDAFKKVLRTDFDLKEEILKDENTKEIVEETVEVSISI